MPNVLILSRSIDAHVPPVVEELSKRGVETIHFNLADFPKEVTLAATLISFSGSWSGGFTHQGHMLSFENLVSVWRRRPTSYKVAEEGYTLGQKKFIEEEADRAFLGIVESFSQAPLVVSQTHAVRRAELKALQLAIAQRLGMRVPRTLLTNDPVAAKAFYETCKGQVILKAVSRGIIDEQSDALNKALYTTKIETEHLSENRIQQMRLTGHVLQEYIPKALEVRVVVIGKRVFTAEIHSPHLDFRERYGDNSYKVHQLPAAVEHQVLALVKEFELQFSSMDLLVSPDGEYLFIDLNPNGQWLWLQQHIGEGFPLKEAMADLLAFPKDFCL
jgi:hypothetical protein